jgi:hypothetical protein
MAPLLMSEEIEFISDKMEDLAENKSSLKIVWKNVFLIGSLHIGALYGAYLMITAAKYQTVIAWYIFCLLSGKKNLEIFLYFLTFN